MIINYNISTNSFIFCNVYQGPHETTAYLNQGNGHFHEYVYVVEGSATAGFSLTETADESVAFNPITQDSLYNIEDSRGKYVITKTENSGISFAMFNPIPDTKHLAVEIVKGEQIIEVTATDQRKTIVCIQGKTTVNDKKLACMQYAVVFEDTGATLTLQDKAICAIVTG